MKNIALITANAGLCLTMAVALNNDQGPAIIPLALVLMLINF